jgi:S-DNA-T family DNA segregation ATPase FtsK/SpoIIIE
MPNCYICGIDISKGEGYRREVYTGSSGRIYFSKRSSGSYGMYFGIRTVCANCASSIDVSHKNEVKIVSLISTIIGGTILILMGQIVLGIILTLIVSFMIVRGSTKKKEAVIEFDQVDVEEIKRADIKEKLPISQLQAKELSFPGQSYILNQHPIDEKIEEEIDEEIDYISPSVELLATAQPSEKVTEEKLKKNAEVIRAKLAAFGITIEEISITSGPIFTLYELVPAADVKVSRITSLKDDLSMALSAKELEITPSGFSNNALCLQVLNDNPSPVPIRSVINTNKFRDFNGYLPVALGKLINGDIYIDDLTLMPHLLIAGAPRSGKSMGINTILASLLFKLQPSDVKFVIIDPKKIELTLYSKLKNHFLAVSPDIDEEIITTPENAVAVLKSVEMEMEKRYDRLASAGVRNIQDYNERFKVGRLKNTETITHRKMPYLIVVIDELADLMLTAAGDVEDPIARLAQSCHSVGIHLVLATQRPSTGVITGIIKANFSARIAYQVASKIDSRTILDMNGAEQLLGKGDMLYLPVGSSKPMRIQNAIILTDEIELLTDHIARQQGYSKPFQLPSILEKKRSGIRGTSSKRDEFFEEAARLVVRHQQGSVSLIQRRLKVSFSRAACLIDGLEAAGIVGPFDGSKARLVLIDTDDQLERILANL